MIERPLQLVCDLEIGGENDEVQTTLNPEAAEFKPRQRRARKAGEDARDQIATLKLYENEEE